LDIVASAGEFPEENGGESIMKVTLDITQCRSGEGRILRAAGLAFVLLVVWPLWAAPAADQTRLVAADNSFAFGLLRELAREQVGQNVFASPYSISTVLQMVASGAAGSTREDMARVLGTTGWEANALNQAHKDLATALRAAEGDVVLKIANALWYSVAVELKPAFVTLNRDFYAATLDPLDFTDPRTAGIVNAWAEKNTQGRIKNIIAGPLPGDTSLLLANAIYFKGAWDRKFDAKETRDRPFHLADGGQRQVPMMQQSGRFDYRERNGCQAVRLPYQGRRLAMSIFLPEPGSSVSKLLATFDPKLWQDEFLRQVPSRQGTLILPRLKLDYGAELKSPLQAMGMKLPFSRAANFSGMSATPQYLSAVKHKSFIEVNEEGTEAAAATVAVMRPTSVQPAARPFEMLVDRPFLFVIADNQTQAILFLGVVFEPGS
jgi:serine protease inhibitor